MANTIPCPNPVCPHDFSQAELQAATQVVCPKCGFRMEGKGAATPKPAAKSASTSKIATPAVKADPRIAEDKAKTAAASKPAPKPAAKPSAPAPAKATPITPKSPSGPPLATPIAASPSSGAVVAGNPPASPVGDDSFFNPNMGAAGPLVRTGAPKKKFNWLRLAIVVLVVGFAASVVIIAIAAIVWAYMGTDGFGGLTKLEGDAYIGNIRNSKNENEKIYKLMLAKKEWSIDSEIATRFGAHAAWKSNDYDFWFALAVKDHGMFKPRDAEMLRLGIEKLENHFGDALELDTKAEAATFGTLPAKMLKFRGEFNNTKWRGECYMFFNTGIAYWLYIASPDEVVVKHFADELPAKHVFTMSDRRGWREQPPPMETFVSVGGKLEMTAPKGVWEKSNPKNEDPDGEILLSGRYLREKDNRKNALLLAFTMEKKADLKEAVTAVRKYLDDKVKNDNENFKIVQAADVAGGKSELGKVDDVGNRRGRMIDLKLQFQDEPKRYYLLSVINEPDICYAILCDCAWESRQIWQQDFLDVLRTLKVK